MFAIHKFFSRAGRLGQPLESPYPVFDAENIKFRYGATSMIAGKPGAFKSVLALNLLSRWVRNGHTALYFSADSDERTVAARLSAIITGTLYEVVDSHFMARDYERYIPALEKMNDCRFEYRAMDLDKITDHLNTYEAVYGDYPDLVFVDNLINFAPSTDDWGFMRDMTNALDGLARETKSHICILHHASEGYGEHSDPVPSKAIQGKISQIPRLVLTTAAAGTNLSVSCVKNTNGPQYPDAQRFMNFEVQSTLRVIDNYEEALA